jgi:hypothetical protein
MRRLAHVSLVFLPFVFAASVGAFTLEMDTVERYFDDNPSAAKRKIIPVVDRKAPVHQDLTRKTLDCGTIGSPCEALIAAKIDPNDVMHGIRWNDFPAFYLTKNPRNCAGRILRITNQNDVPCFIAMLGYSWWDSDRLRADTEWTLKQPLGARGHFGDMQFWHSMAPSGQTAGETYDLIQMWMEFAFRVSLGDLDLNSDAYDAPIPGLKNFFWRGARRVGDLVDYRYNDQKEMAKGLALGQLLHLSQDSFAKCHADRDGEGKLIRFYDYSGQSSGIHKRFDSEAREVATATTRRLNPVDFGQRLLRLRAESVSWDDAKPKLHKLVEEYFQPQNPYLLSRYGSDCV